MTTATSHQDIATTNPITPPPGAAWVDKWEGKAEGYEDTRRAFHLNERVTDDGHKVVVWGEQHANGTLGELDIHINGPDCDDEVCLEYHDDVDQLIEHLRAAQAECRALRAWEQQQ